METRSPPIIPKEVAMRLDPFSLEVQSFETESPEEEEVAQPTEPIDPETRFHPCTRQLTCVGCA
jgi:hypothetical protein